MPVAASLLSTWKQPKIDCFSSACLQAQCYLFYLYANDIKPSISNYSFLLPNPSGSIHAAYLLSASTQK